MVMKQIAARLPHRWQSELKRLHFGRQIARNDFNTSEAEYQMLSQWVQPGDWVLDIGANVGQYTKRLSDLVGAEGRVIAFEPVPATFALLSANAERFQHGNVSLFNAAVSGKLDVLGMDIPRFASGLVNYYQAHLTEGGQGATRVLTLPIDALQIDRRVSLIKVDAEGHEAQVIDGMQALLARWKPLLIVETGSQPLVERITSLGYEVSRLAGSSNVVCRTRPA